MNIVVYAKPAAKREKVEVIAGLVNTYKVWVKESAVDGKANHAMVKLLAAHFKVPQYKVSLTAGARAKIKRFCVDV